MIQEENAIINIPEKNLMDLGNKSRIHQEMKSIVSDYLNNKKYTALLLIIVSLIDSFVIKQKDNKNHGKRYSIFMEKYFPEYFSSELLTAKKFYTKFRCPIVHDFTIGKGYAIAQDEEIDAQYVAKVKCKNKVFIALNIDKLANDFLCFIEKINR